MPPSLAEMPEPGAVQVDLALGELADNAKAAREILGTTGQAGNDRRHIGRQRIGVHGGDEDGIGDGIRGGHLAVGAGAKRGPRTRFHQQGTRRLTRGTGRLAETAKRNSVLSPSQLDLHRYQRASGATMNPLDHPGSRSGVKHSRRLPIFEELLPSLHHVTFRHEHARTHAHAVISQNGDVSNGGPFFDPLFRAARNGQVESLFEFVLCHLSTLLEAKFRIP